MGQTTPVKRPAVRRRKPRSLLRSLLDGGVFVVVLAMILFAVRQAGWLETQSGDFIAVDGDSLRKGNQDYRLHAIDAPELHQMCEDGSGATYPCGRQAQAALRRLVSSGSVTCRVIENDRYGRLVAICRAGKIDINDEMVRQGWALAYRQHGLDYIGAEAEAKAGRRGIWQGRFEMPEDWRAGHRARTGSMSAGTDRNEPD